MYKTLVLLLWATASAGELGQAVTLLQLLSRFESYVAHNDNMLSRKEHRP